MNNKEIARVLVTITEEQWEAILDSSTQMAFKVGLNKTLKADNGCEKSIDNELRFEITNLINEIGVPPHYLGYTYLQEAIMLAYEDENYIHNIVKGLYVDVAKKYESTSSRVERAIRHALDTVCREGNPVVIQKVFKTRGDKITNSYAIAAIVEYLKMHD